MDKDRYVFRLTRKDLILYALSIGVGSEGDEEDLRFVYERHPRFSPLPIFCLTFTFWSNELHKDQTSGRIPRFPPPLMAKESVIPKQYLKGNVELKSYPIIHTWQSIVWEHCLPIGRDDDAVETSIDLKTILVQPKSVGTFVTTQSKVKFKDPYTNDEVALCTMQSTALVFGISRDHVSAYDAGVTKLTVVPKIPDTPPILEWTFATKPNQALLYRLASGDSNHIHVDTAASEMMGSDKKAPLLHGLFTLAAAFRGILKVAPDADHRIRRLEVRFTQPAFVGDTLLVRIWKNGQSGSKFLFTVTNKETGATLADCGYAELKANATNQTSKI